MINNRDFEGIDANKLAGGAFEPPPAFSENKIMRNTDIQNSVQFVPEKDYFETTEDGRTIQIAVKGVPLPVGEAQKLGLMKNAEAEETKSETPTANKAKTPPPFNK